MATAKVEIVLDREFEHPEGIVWDGRRGKLMWVDIFEGRVLSLDLSTSALQEIELGRAVGAVAPRRSGGLVCAVREGFGLVSESGEFELVSSQLEATPYLQMNDGGVDARGRFWAGSMSFEYETRPGTGSLYRLDPDGTVTEELTGISVSNGIGWSPDSSICYYIDSATRRIDRYAFDADSGRLGARSTLAEVDALPDGLAVDEDGCIWVALFLGGEVRRFTPEGHVDRVVQLPGSQVTTCTFGGDDLRTLFIAVSPYGMSDETRKQQRAGYIYAFEAGVAGVPTNEFLG